MPNQIFAFNPGVPAFPLTPYLYINISLNPGRVLDSNALSKYLEDVASEAGGGAQGEGEWLLFARKENLMAGEEPFIRPQEWYYGGRRWIAVSKPSRWEIHLYVGLCGAASNSQSLVNLATETNKWLHKVPSKLRPLRKILSRAPVISGEVKVANYETGIRIASRQGFLRTLAGKDSAAVAIGLIIPIIGYFIRNHVNDEWSGILGQIGTIGGVAILTILLTAIIRHFFIIPRFIWNVDKLHD